MLTFPNSTKSNNIKSRNLPPTPCPQCLWPSGRPAMPGPRQTQWGSSALQPWCPQSGATPHVELGRRPPGRGCTWLPPPALVRRARGGHSALLHPDPALLPGPPLPVPFTPHPGRGGSREWISSRASAGSLLALQPCLDPHPLLTLWISVNFEVGRAPDPGPTATSPSSQFWYLSSSQHCPD